MEQIVILTGFMGAGKTSVARQLAAQLEWQAVDLDDEIQTRNGRTISTIFEMDGEEKFRELETDALQHALGRQRIVLATGGGVLIREENRRLLHGRKVINLRATFEQLMQRLEGTGHVRPLVREGREKLETLYNSRRPLYDAVERQIDTAGKTAREAAEEIIARHLEQDAVVKP